MSVSHAGKDAKAFTVGTNIAFNSGEYDPSSVEGQHVLAHELAHVRQQTGGAVSMLPKDDVQLEIDPDPELEKEAEETAQRVMQGGKLDIQRLEDTDVHVQRYPGQEKVEAAREMVSNESDDEYSVPADPEVLAQEVEQLKTRQDHLMDTMLEAKPGAPISPGAEGWAKTAAKGIWGGLAGAGAGAATGAMMGSVGGPAGAAAGAAIGGISGLASSLTKKGMEYAHDRLPGSPEMEMRRMYEEMQGMYKEMKGKRTGSGTADYK